VLYSGGSSYEITGGRVYVIPKELKTQYAEWDEKQRAYIVLSKIHTNEGVITEPMMIDEFLDPSDSPLVTVYSGESAKRFIKLAVSIISRYYRGGIMSLPLSNRDCYRFAVALSRMASLEPIADIV